MGLVMPAQAGIYLPGPACVPAFAGMTALPPRSVTRPATVLKSLSPVRGAAHSGADVFIYDWLWYN